MEVLDSKTAITVAEVESDRSMLDNAGHVRERNAAGQYLPIDGVPPLTHQQRMAIEMLSSGGKTRAQVARALGKDALTLANWGKKPAFQAALQEACNAKLQMAAAEALELLNSQVTNRRLDPYVRQNAARDLLNRAGMGTQRDVQATQIIIETSGGVPELGQAQEIIVDAEAVQITPDEGEPSSNQDTLT